MPGPAGIIGAARTALRRRGWVSRLRRAALIAFRPSYRRWLREERAFDLAHGVDTAGNVYVSELGVPVEKQKHAARYQAVARALFDEVLGRLPIDHGRYVFVDIGSGKGRPLLLASHYPFRRIVGVELSPRLTEIALKNIRAYRPPEQKCRAIEARCGDAAQFELPGGPFVLHLNNPFDGHVMRRLRENLERSVEREPRPGYLVYFTPLERAVLDASPLLRVESQSEYHVLYRIAGESG